MNETFLFDTYALIEILKGSSNYENYVGCDVVVTQFILAELAYYLERKSENRKKKELLLKDFSLNVIHPDNDVLIKAANMRYKRRKQNMSITDCIGYKLAEEIGVKFLTGDKEFEDLENVEYVK